MKCSNCETPAAYIYSPVESVKMPFCIPCMPSFLVPRMKAGLLDKAEDFDAAIAEVTKILAQETEPVEEILVEDVASEKPVKKSSKKSTGVQTDEQ